MPHHILVVDDEIQVLDMLEKFLGKQLGYLVQTAESGQAAIDKSMETNFDLCILDVNMPDLSGPETYLRLKAICPGLEALFFTGLEDFENTQDFLRFSLPADRVVQKPFEDLSELTQLIIGILGPPIP